MNLTAAADEIVELLERYERARRPGRGPRGNDRDLNPAGPSVRLDSVAFWSERVGRAVSGGELLADLFAEMRADESAFDASDLVGSADIAKMLGVTRAAVTNWATRGTLPPPVARLASGPVYRLSDVRDWLPGDRIDLPPPSGIMVNPRDLASNGDIARTFAVKTEAVSNMAARHADFPKPVAVVAAGPIYLLSEVRLWHERRDR